MAGNRHATDSLWMHKRRLPIILILNHQSISVLMSAKSRFTILSANKSLKIGMKCGSYNTDSVYHNAPILISCFIAKLCELI